MKRGKYPEGHLIGLGIVFGLLLGIPIGGIFLENIALGPAIGLPIGLATGALLEEKYKKEGRIRALTKKEKKFSKKLAWIGGLVLGLGLLVFAGALYFFAKG